jgi:hypothetical protein
VRSTSVLAFSLGALAGLVQGGGEAGLEQALHALGRPRLAQERLGEHGGAAGDLGHQDLRGVVVAGRELALQVQVGVGEALGPEPSDGAGVAVLVHDGDGWAVQALGPLRHAGAGQHAQLDLQALGLGHREVLVDSVVGDDRPTGGELQVGPGDLGDEAVDGAAEAGRGRVVAVEQATEDRLEPGLRGGGGAGAGGGGEGAAMATAVTAVTVPRRLRRMRRERRGVSVWRMAGPFLC